MIGIVDYGSGNISAIAHIFKRQNIPYKVVANPDQLALAKKLVLPGVGAFDETIRLLDNSGFRSALDKAVIEDRTPILGVCVGMQVMAASSEEGSLQGLNWIPGKVKKFLKSEIDSRVKLPHMGWNSINCRLPCEMFSDIDVKKGFYFLHSYYFDCESDDDVLATASYGKKFACAINKSNVFGFQFHPEKSHSNGIQLFTNFARL